MAGKTHRIGTSIIDVAKVFATEEACLALLETARWPEGVRCLKCDFDKVSRFVTNETTRKRINSKGVEVTVMIPARHVYLCNNAKCKHQFTATAGTVFNDTHLPLNKWFMAAAMMCNAKKGLSAKQMERDLGVSYKTAWYLCHRIRKAMDEGLGDLMTGTVEADETYVGGKFDKRRKRAKYDKEPVFGVIERGGRIHVSHLEQENRYQIMREIKENVAPEAKMMTDESRYYISLQKHGFQHEIVVHSNKEWVRGDVHTQNIDGFWSLFKSGLIGSFHQVSIKHLHRYLNEFEFRFNNKRNEDIFAIVLMNLVIQKGIKYAELTGKKGEQVPKDEYEPF